jgi:hypothetical protein
VTVIKTVKKGWTEQYSLMVYEIVANVDGTEFRAVRTVTIDIYNQDATRFENEAREQITKDATAQYE